MRNFGKLEHGGHDVHHSGEGLQDLPSQLIGVFRIAKDERDSDTTYYVRSALARSSPSVVNIL